MNSTADNSAVRDANRPSDERPEAPAQQIADYHIGGLDKRGRRVLDIFWSTKDFIIFQHAGGISPHFSDEDELSREQARRYMRLGPNLSRINALLPPPGAPTDGKALFPGGLSFFHTPNTFLYRETARAIANALTGDDQRAVEILAFVEARLMARRRAQGQFQYLLACMVALIFIVVAEALLEWSLPRQETPWKDLIRIATCGAAGGFLSVAIGIRKLDIDPDTSWWVNAYYGLIRLTIAIVSAFVLYFLISAKLVLQPVFAGASVQQAYALYALAIAAGFSETLIPNILRRTEERVAVAADQPETMSPIKVTSNGASEQQTASRQD